jgi:hypothetical protein
MVRNYDYHNMQEVGSSSLVGYIYKCESADLDCQVEVVRETIRLHIGILSSFLCYMPIATKGNSLLIVTKADLVSHF